MDVETKAWELLSGYLLTLPNLIAIVFSYKIIDVMDHAFPKFSRSKIGKTLKPFAPIFWVAVALVLYDQTVGDNKSWQHYLLMSVCLGPLTGWAHGALLQRFSTTGAIKDAYQRRKTGSVKVKKK